jgi:hypothetical protein
VLQLLPSFYCTAYDKIKTKIKIIKSSERKSGLVGSELDNGSECKTILDGYKAKPG